MLRTDVLIFYPAPVIENQSWLIVLIDSADSALCYQQSLHYTEATHQKYLMVI